MTGGGSNQVTIGRDSETEWFVSCHYRDWADWVDVGDIPDSLEEILPLSLRLTSVGFIRYARYNAILGFLNKLLKYSRIQS